jgi:eight-cysteine-cluster-containing protein
MRLLNIFYLAIVVALLSINSSFAEPTNNNSKDNYPTYESGILTIPRIDTSSQPGNFLSAIFKNNGQGIWELLSFKAADQYPLQKAPITGVRLIVTDSFPTQVILNIKGWVGGCLTLGQINQRLVNNRFEVTVHAENPDSPLGTYTCTANVTVFDKNIPLSVYDLAAGNYEYSINGGDYVGSFTLTKNNRYATSGCLVSGCSGQLCTEASGEGLITTCEYREEYACYKTAVCERQSSGQCGWTETPGLAQCLVEKRKLNP